MRLCVFVDIGRARGWEREIAPAVCSVCLTSDQMVTELWHRQSQKNEHNHYLEVITKPLCAKYLVCVFLNNNQRRALDQLWMRFCNLSTVVSGSAIIRWLWVEFFRNTHMYKPDKKTVAICWLYISSTFAILVGQPTSLDNRVHLQKQLFIPLTIHFP